MANHLFDNVPRELWNDWHWQLKNRISTVEELKQYLTLTQEEEEGIKRCLEKLRMKITPYYLSLINLDDPHDPIRKQAVPTINELHTCPADLCDPLHEDTDSPVKVLLTDIPTEFFFSLPISAVCTVVIAREGVLRDSRIRLFRWSRLKNV